MHLIISRKLTSVHGNPQVITRESVQQAVNASGATSYVAMNEKERDEYITRQTRQGFTCHTFDYADSFQSVTSIQSVKAA